MLNEFECCGLYLEGRFPRNGRIARVTEQQTAKGVYGPGSSPKTIGHTQSNVLIPSFQVVNHDASTENPLP